MPPAPSSANVALTRLRRTVTVGCWVIALALGVQLVIWSLAAFTELRFDEVTVKTDEAPLIVEAAPQENNRSRSNGLPLPPVNGNATENAASGSYANASDEFERGVSNYDHHFAATFNLAAGLGRSAMVIVVVLVAIGLMLGVASSVAGIEKGVSALTVALLLAILVLPTGPLLGLPWTDGALSHYEHMTARADHINALHDARLRESVEANASDDDNAAAQGNETGAMVMFLMRFGVLPVTCVALVSFLGLRFAASIEAAALPRENMRLDPAIEREASNITPTSLHGVRGGSPFSSAISKQNDGHANGANGHNGQSDSDNSRSIRQPSPGEAPKRLI